MRRVTSLVLVLALLVGLWPVSSPVLAGANPKILVNEFFRGGGDFTTDEWVEVVLLENLTAAQLEGFYVGDSASSTESKYSGYKFTGMSAIAPSFSKGTIIVIGGSSAIAVEDTAYDPENEDWNLSLWVTGTYLIDNGATFPGNLGGTDVVYVDINGTNGDDTLSASGFAVNWDSSPGTFGALADVTIAVTPNNTGAALVSDLAGARTAGNWSVNLTGTALTLGAPNGGANTTYINKLRSAAKLSLSKSAPISVTIGEVFTYTLVASNAGTGQTLTDLVITDTLPLSVTAQTISDGGVALPGNLISWTVASLAVGASVTRTVSVLAPDVNVQLSNADYAVVASNWVTPTKGSPVNTAVGGQLVDIGAARGMSGQLVTVAGRATMYTGGFYAGSGDVKFYIQDATGGIAVQCFDQYGAVPAVTLGDLVTVTGVVGAYQGELQVVPGDNVDDVTVVDGAPADVPYPRDVLLSDFNSPDNLGWLTRVLGRVVGVQHFAYNDIVVLTDGIVTVTVYIDANTGIDTGEIEAYDDYRVTGIAERYASTYELKPRVQGDLVELVLPALRVRKYAPQYVVTGSPYVYTLIATNNTTDTLNNLVLTDTLPANVTLDAALDGGVQVGNTISWTAASLAPGEALTVSFRVTATGAAGATIVNADYGALADEWMGLAGGPAIETRITAGCDSGDTPIYAIQGNGAASPLDGDAVTVCGVVIGVAPGVKGFFIQDVVGDGDPATSDGVFVYRNARPYNVAVGDLVEVSGDVDEYYASTQINATAASDVLTIMSNNVDLPHAIELNPPATRAAADVYLETLEGMLVEVPLTVTVVGPTNAYGEYYFVRGETGLSRILRDDIAAFDGYRLGVDDSIVASDDYVVGDVLLGIAGPLHYTFDNWKVEQIVQPTAVSLVVVPDTLPQYPPLGQYQVALGAFNTLNFDGLDTEVKLNKVVSNIVALGGPAILSLEEIAAMDTWDSDGGYTITAVLDDLVAALAAQGYTYASAYTHPDVGGHGVAVLYNPDVFVLDAASDLQGCSSVGSGSSTYDPIWATCQAINQYPLFSRRPVVLTGTFTLANPPVPVTFIGAHLKSGIGVAADEQRRLEQAQLIAAFVAELQADGQENVVVAGDLNDFMDSAPLQVLQTTGMLTDTFYTVPPEGRYSYIYNGVSQVLDHILVSAALFEKMDFFMPLHTNSDFPTGWESDPAEAYSVSDHDPVQATFTLWDSAQVTLTKSVVPTAGVFPGDLVTYTLVLRNDSSIPATGVQLVDVLPWEVTFMDWLDHPAGASVTDDVVTWSGTLTESEPVEISFVASVRADSFFYAHPVVNTAEFTADNSDPGEASATFEIGGEMALEIEKSVVAVEPAPGDVVTYTLMLHNPSAALVGDVALNDTLPATLDFGEWVQQSGAEQSNDTITWSGDLASGNTVSIVFTAVIRADAPYMESITNTVSYVAAGTMTGSDSASFMVEIEPALFIEKTVSPATDVALGGTVTYTLRMYNPVDTIATGILVTDALPAELDFGGWVWQSTATQSADVVTWSGSLEPGGIATVVFTATLHNDPLLYGQTITNTARFVADGGLSGADAAPLTVVAESSELSIVKTVAPEANVALGGVVTYTIELSNLVAATAADVVLVDALPSALTFGGWVGAAPAGAIQVGNTITWTGDMVQGSPLALVFTATLGSDPALSGQTVVNVASFTSATAGGGSDSASFTVAAAAEDFFVFLPLVMRQTP